jgi:signal transduction histidine kinase
MLAKIAFITIKNAWLYQQAVQARQELESFSRVKKEFIDHTSHELRTPLTVLKSSLWSIESDEMESGIMVDMAKDAVLRLQSKIEQILSLNDIEPSETVLNLEIKDVSSILEDCLREALPEIEEKGITVRVDDRARYRDVMVDTTKIKIVFRNIIENAINHVKQGGNITVTTSVSDSPPGVGEGVEVGKWSTLLGQKFLDGALGGESGTLQGDSTGFELMDFLGRKGSSYIVVRIKDDGIGIPSEEIENLAEPFKRTSNSPFRNVKGLGVGLSVSQRIVAGHGGRFFCRSIEGEGAEFSIWLPLSE